MTPDARRPRLIEAERRLLLALMAAEPDASFGAVARRFEAEAGRPLSVTSVRRAWMRGDRPAGPSNTGRILSEAERSVLVALCREVPARQGSVPIVARLFEERTGRSIGPDAIRRARRDALGLPRTSRSRKSARPTTGGSSR